MKDVVLTHSLSAGGLIRQLLRKVHPERHIRVIASYDDYSHGTLPATDTSRDFFEARRAFWASSEVYDPDLVGADDLTDEQTNLVQVVTSAKDVEIWISDTVGELFYAAVTLYLLDLDRVDVSGILIRHLAGRRPSYGLRGIGDDELEALYLSSRAEPFDPVLYSAAWKAISSGSGQAIKAFIDENDPSGPMVKALSAYLLRFPDYNGGLGSIDRALLGAGTDVMRNSAYTVGNAMVLGPPENDTVGDHFLFRRLVELCHRGPDPWFTLEGDPRTMRSCSVQLTESGREARERYSVQILRSP